jgi:mannose-6-phosphate isomerase
MTSLYPLKFKPRFVEKIWGGRKLEAVLGKKLPEGKPVGESWELYDFPPGVVDQSGKWVSSEVASGSLAGRTLHDLVGEYGRALHGDVPLLNAEQGGQFPILIKFLDAREDLSLQVHPPKQYADAHPGSHLKTEAWYVMENDPGAKLYRGLRPGVTADQFRQGITDGSVMDQVNAIAVKPGQCFFLPSGTVHALGAGILVAEVQTPSDTTFRVFDFNRLENGKPRKLHVDEALACIDFSGAAEPQQARSHTASFFTTVTRLVTSEFFKIEKVRFVEGVEEAVPYDQPVVWMMLEGRAELRVAGMKEPVTLTKGETVLLPAAMREPVIKTQSACSWLEVTFPTGADIGE